MSISELTPQSGPVQDEVQPDPADLRAFVAACDREHDTLLGLDDEASTSDIDGVTATQELVPIPRKAEERSDDSRAVDHEGTRIMTYQDRVKMLNAARLREPSWLDSQVRHANKVSKQKAHRNAMIRGAMSCLAAGLSVALFVADAYTEAKAPMTATLGTLQPKDTPSTELKKPIVTEDQLKKLPATEARIRRMADAMRGPLYVDLSNPNDAADPLIKKVRARMAGSISVHTPPTLEQRIVQTREAGLELAGSSIGALLIGVADGVETLTNRSKQDGTYVAMPLSKAVLGRTVDTPAGTATKLSANYDAQGNFTGASVSTSVLGPGSQPFEEAKIEITPGGYTMTVTDQQSEECTPERGIPHSKTSTDLENVAPFPTEGDLAFFEDRVADYMIRMANTPPAHTKTGK